jgi:hypothetical protein
MYARGIDVLAPSLDGLFEFVRTQVTTTVTEDPPGVVTAIGDEALTLTLDEHLSVVDVSGGPSGPADTPHAPGAADEADRSATRR